ncbi:MAG: hypothetical protein KME17_23730 [Cyanosarcina radialis HA8281-LM2]|jgi:hypothetical protein|nr:hypothetical protein [Cyanosarcina radialis HA8281-LM2]
MSHNRLEAHDNGTSIDFSEERLDALVELADAIRELTAKFDRVEQTIDIYESKLLRTEPQMLALQQQPDSETLKRWQEFVERVSTELNTLTPPV